MNSKLIETAANKMQKLLNELTPEERYAAMREVCRMMDEWLGNSPQLDEETRVNKFCQDVEDILKIADQDQLTMINRGAILEAINPEDLIGLMIR